MGLSPVFVTQSTSLEPFLALAGELDQQVKLDRVGFYVSDSLFFREFSRRKHLPSSWKVVKEWEIVRKGLRRKADRQLLRHYENCLGNPNLWGALVCDRRILYVPRATMRQDYKPRFDHEQMLGILQEALVQIEQLFDQLRPDVVFSFVCNTFGDYLSYLVARTHGIPCLNLRPTRIKNYMTLGSTVFEPPEHVERLYRHYQRHGLPGELEWEAKAYLQNVVQRHAMYEGVTPIKTRGQKPKSPQGNPAAKLWSLAVKELEYLKWARSDHHVRGVLAPVLYKKVLNRLRERRVNRALRKSYLDKSDLERIEYAFFPLHTEPEVTLLVYARSYLNQIEVVRNVAQSLPVTMKLVVKEHPVSIGKRPLKYYRKLLEIPNVVLASPYLTSRDVIQHARLVTVIAGSVGLEALMLGKPVISLGGTPYQFLQGSMHRFTPEPSRLGSEIRWLLENYRFDELQLIGYISAVMKGSVAIDWYSGLLKKKGVYREQKDEDSRNDIKALATYALARLNEERELLRDQPAIIRGEQLL